ncbi:MAG: selenocysteine-specific translation elongation factor [Planctomycetota bacterium]
MTEVHPVPVVIGTAGHIDHGKSALVEALCGTHPDRWQEEKDRGITIDLGYAQYAYPDGLELGFVDVPGHEKLVRKMVAGATGMGAALLVVACDDGVMLQTREHFEVLTLLGVDCGMIALTKSDLADEDTLMLVEEEVLELIAGSAWEGAKILPVSAHTGDGIEDLRAALRELALSAKEVSDPRLAFRLPIQRSFGIDGAGTIATGVCAAGKIEAGQDLVVLPAEKRSRVRRVQVHGRQAQVGEAGLRTALNLPDLDKADCERGSVLVAPEAARCGTLLRMSVKRLPDAPKLKHDSEVQLLAGTAALDAKIYFAANQETEELFVDIVCEHPIALVPGQRCLLRRPSPAKNIGVARFLGYGKFRLRKKDTEERDYCIKVRAALDDPEAMLVLQLERGDGAPKKASELAPELGWTVSATTKLLDELAEAKKVQKVGTALYVAAGSAQAMMGEIQGVIENFRGKNPGRLMIPIQRFRDRLGKKGWKVVEKMPDSQLEMIGLQRRRGEQWVMTEASASEEVVAAAVKIRTVLKSGGLVPMDWKDVVAQSGLPADLVDACRGYLLDSGQAVQPSQGLIFDFDSVDAFRLAVVGQLQGGGMDIPALRDQFGTTRKYVMPLLEFLDDCGVTERVGPNRLLQNAEASLR